MDAHDLLARVPEAVDTDAVSEVEATAQFEIERPLALRLRDGQVEVIEGRVEAPDVTIQASDALLLDLFHGRARPTTAFMTGKLKVKGNLGLAQRLIGAVDRDRLASAANEAENG